MDNPFSKLLSIMREEGGQGSSSFYLGKVSKENEITFNGITLYKEDLLINPVVSFSLNDEVLLLQVGEKFLIMCKVVEL